MHDFGPALRRLLNELEGEKDGLFLILDDINGLALKEEFAHWLKSLIDEIAVSSARFPICIVLVGLDEKRLSLIGLNSSLARYFDTIEVKAWSREEAREFFRKTFSKVGIDVQEEAADWMASFSGGLPMLGHEIGEAVFNADDDSHIGIEDAIIGIRDAAEIVGRKHLEPAVFDAIRSERYRAILRKAAFSFEFQRKNIKDRLNDRETKVLDNFLRKMLELGVLLRVPEKGTGYYRFRNQLHYMYFAMEARREAEE